MNTQEQDRQDARLRAALTAAYPSAEPSDTLKRRLEAEAERHEEKMFRRAVRRRRTRLSLAFAGFAVLAVIATLIGPKFVAAQELARIQNAINDAHSVHSIEWSVGPDGKRIKQSETWFQAGQWRIERWRANSDKGPDVEICADGSHWKYDSFKNMVTYDRQTRPDGLQYMSGFSIGASVKDMALIGVLMDVREEGRSVSNGRTVRNLIIRDNKYPSDRSLLVVDAQTDLPLGGEGQSEQDGRWVTRSVGEEHYNEMLSADLFGHDFPKTARMIDRESERRVWEQRLSEGIVTKQIADTSLVYPEKLVNGQMMRTEEWSHQPRRLVVRDFQVNRAGDVFLLFTAGDSMDRAGQFGSVELEDEFGTKYLPDQVQAGAAWFIATCRDADGRGGSVVDGYTFQGQPLDGTWWVPVEPSRTHWKQRSFRLTFHLDGPVSSNENSLNLSLQKPEADIMPDYMPYMARPLYEVSVQTGEALRRAYYYRDQKHDLAMALFWFRQTIAVMRADDVRTGAHYDASIEWFAIYQILTQLGRNDEAKAALLHADEDAVYSSPTRDKIRAEMEKIGHTQ